MDSSGSRWGRMADACEHGYIIPGSVKSDELLTTLTSI